MSENKNLVEIPRYNILECGKCGHPNLVEGINRFICPECHTPHHRVGGAHWLMEDSRRTNRAVNFLVGWAVGLILTAALILGLGTIGASISWLREVFGR